jgi:hypothetical protein
MDKDTIILTYDRGADHLDIGGTANSLDLMLDMLGRATRAIEGRWRVERAIELQQQFKQAAADQALAAAIRNGR